MCVKRYRNSVGPRNKSAASWVMYKEPARFWTATNSTGWVVFFLAQCPGTTPSTRYLFKMVVLTSGISALPWQASDGDAATSFSLSATLSSAAFSRVSLLNGSCCVSSAHTPCGSLSISCIFSYSNKPLSWNCFYARSRNKNNPQINQTTARMSKSLRQRAQGVDVSSLLTTVAWLLQQRAGREIWSRVSKDITVSSCRQYRARRKANRWLEAAQSDGSMELIPVYIAFARLSGCCHWCWRWNGVSGMISPSRRCQALIWTAVNSHGSRRSCKSSSPGFPLQELLSQPCPSFPKCLCAIFAYAAAKPSAGSCPIRSCNSYQIQKTASQVHSLC